MECGDALVKRVELAYNVFSYMGIFNCRCFQIPCSPLLDQVNYCRLGRGLKAYETFVYGLRAQHSLGHSMSNLKPGAARAVGQEPMHCHRQWPL